MIIPQAGNFAKRGFQVMLLDFFREMEKLETGLLPVPVLIQTR